MDHNGSQLLEDASPQPAPIPRQPTPQPEGLGLFFSGKSPQPAEESQQEFPSPAGPGSDSEAGFPDESPASPDSTSSRGTTPAPDGVEVELLSEEDLVKLARGGVAVAGQKAHEMFAVTPGQQHVGLYKTTEGDQSNIGDPLARIASRHQGVGGKVNPDTKDFLSALVGLFGYATKQINKRSEARQFDGAGALQDLEPVDL